MIKSSFEIFSVHEADRPLYVFPFTLTDNECKWIKVDCDNRVQSPPTFCHFPVCGILFYRNVAAHQSSCASAEGNGIYHNLHKKRKKKKKFYFCSSTPIYTFLDPVKPDMIWNIHRSTTDLSSSQYSHSSTAGPPTLLEDGQCYRGNQLKQSLDGWEVVCLTGKDMHHLKQQDVKSNTIFSCTLEIGLLKGKVAAVGNRDQLYMSCGYVMTCVPKASTLLKLTFKTSSVMRLVWIHK